eukprot:scaffold35882_cov64-Attheya_sp.AAC.1
MINWTSVLHLAGDGGGTITLCSTQSSYISKTRSDVRIVDNGTARCLMCIGNVRTSDLKLAMESERSGAMLIVSQCHRAIYFVLERFCERNPDLT